MVVPKCKLWHTILLLTLGAILLFPAISHDQSFQYRKAITIDHAMVPASLTDFPVLISISDDKDVRFEAGIGRALKKVYEQLLDGDTTAERRNLMN